MNDINFVEVDAQQINNELINNFEAELGETLYPGDERRVFLEQETQILVGLKNSINDCARQNLLRYARGEKLDALGERTGTPRLSEQKAKTTFRIMLSEARNEDTHIEAGIRGTPDGKLYFATKEAATIQAGQTFVDVAAEAAEAGEKYNGFAPGQIKTLVDPIPYVASLTNIEESYDGSDIEPDDDGINVWSGYRERIRQAPSKFSTAGPEDAYIYWAKTADVNISDVAVSSPNPGEVKITVLMKDGELPGQQVLDNVLSVCSDKKVRPLTDSVTVSSPAVVNYDINLTYYISSERAAEEILIKNSIENTGGVVDIYKAWQQNKMGRMINPDYLRQLILDAGAFKVEVTAPNYTEIKEDSIAKVSNVTVNYGGLI